MAVLVLPCLLTAAAPPKASINSLEADLDAISKLPHEVVHAGGLSEGVAHDHRAKGVVELAPSRGEHNQEFGC